MIDALAFVGPALAMCLVIASVHVYLGMHVLAREIIFVDLSLAQLAALGATVAGVLEISEHGPWTQAVALAFTLFGALLFTLARSARNFVSQEAIVGIVYAVASALMVLVLSRSPHGSEHIKNVLVGSLLVTTWQNVGFTAIAYMLIGGVHLVFRNQFIALSWDSSPSRPSAMWDFFFYATFGVVITISVQFAGVLLVFTTLVVPAATTRLFSERLISRLLAGWLICAVVSVLGVAISWSWDLPTGATVVAVFGGCMAIGFAVKAVQQHSP